MWQGRYKAILVKNVGYLKGCSRYIHLNPNRAKITRPTERYPWSSYRHYVRCPKVVPWVETGPVLEEFGIDWQRYRDHVESGKGEELVNPFERAVARLVLGCEEHLARIRKTLKARPDPGDQRVLREIRQGGKATPDEVEAAVAAIFPGAHPARRRRLLLYAQRRHSNLRTVETARRYGRPHGAVFLAVRDQEANGIKTGAFAARSKALAQRFRKPNG